MKQYVTTAQLAEALQRPASWVEVAARTGLIPSLKVGRYRRFDPEAVEAALAADAAKPADPLALSPRSVARLNARRRRSA